MVNMNFIQLPPVREEIAAQIAELPIFQGVSTPSLIALAKDTPGGSKVLISDRMTAMVMLVGLRKLSDPALHKPSN